MSKRDIDKRASVPFFLSRVDMTLFADSAVFGEEKGRERCLPTSHFLRCIRTHSASRSESLLPHALCKQQAAKNGRISTHPLSLYPVSPRYANIACAFLASDGGSENRLPLSKSSPQECGVSRHLALCKLNAPRPSLFVLRRQNGVMSAA